MVNNGHCTYRYMVIKYCPYSVHIYKYTHQLPTQQAFHNIEIVVSCSIMQCSRTIFVLCTDFSRVFPQQLQPSSQQGLAVHLWLPVKQQNIFRNNCFSLTESPHSKRQTSLSVYGQFTSLLYFNFYLSTAYDVYFTNLGKFTTDGLNHRTGYSNLHSIYTTILKFLAIQY